jgi:hypothetical protein
MIYDARLPNQTDSSFFAISFPFCITCLVYQYMIVHSTQKLQQAPDPSNRVRLEYVLGVDLFYCLGDLFQCWHVLFVTTWAFHPITTPEMQQYVDIVPLYICMRVQMATHYIHTTRPPCHCATSKSPKQILLQFL